MRKLNLIVFLSLIVGVSQAQFINNGATIIIQSGATLKVDTDFINNSGGTITNNGTLEVKGDFTNAATFNSAAGTTVIFSGDTDSEITSGGAIFQNVEIAKISGDILLMDNATVAATLTFSEDNKVILGDNNLTIQTGGSIDGVTSDRYVVTDGIGQLIKGIDADGTITHEIGDATNYTPLSSAVRGTDYTNATLGARVYTAYLEDKVLGATDFIDREWLVQSTNIADYENTMTGTYVAADATGTQANIKGSTFHNMDWHFVGSDNGTLQVIADTDENEVVLSGQNFFGKVNLKAFLQGPYNVNTGLMNTSLNSTTPANNILEQFALNSPYSDAPASVAAGFFLDHPSIVDWVRLELRDPAAPSTPTTNKVSAFIKNDGTIVGLDGVSFPKIPNVLPTSVVVLSHRNHLAIRTPNDGLDVVEPSLHDFSLSLNNAFENVNLLNASMSELSSNLYGLFRSNVNGDNFINVLDFALTRNATTSSQLNLYSTFDVNLDNFVNVLDFGLTRNSTSSTKTAHQ